MSLIINQARNAVIEAERIESRLDYLRKTEPQSAEIDALMEMTSFRWDENGKAFFNGRITSYTVSSARKMLAAMADRDSFTLYINSIGGMAVAGVALANMFRQSDIKIEGIVIGEAYSSASLLLQGCDVRLVSPGASVGVHRAWAAMIGNAEEMLQAAEDLERMDKSAMEIYSDRVPADKIDELKAMIVKDVALSGKESIELGLADGMFKKKAPKEMEVQAAKPQPAETNEEAAEEFLKEEGEKALDKKREIVLLDDGSVLEL